MILYFSATGNSKYCAEFIASKTNDKIISLNDMMKNNVKFIDCSGENKIGIVVPTYDFDFAYSVGEFIEGLEFRNISSEIYVYGIFTYGSSSGVTENTLREILSRKKINLNAAFTVKMPDNYVLMFPQKSPDVKNKIFEKADLTLEKISEYVISSKSTDNPPKKIPKIFMRLIKKFFIPYQRKVKNFSVNENCTGCGKCEKVCPMNIIKIQNNRPVWLKDNCACCLACLHRCPVKAINRGKSAKNGRYINPNVEL